MKVKLPKNQKDNLRHFIIDGCDWYVELAFHEGQSGDYLNPPMEDYWEVLKIYNSEYQKVYYGVIWDAIADEVERII
jgi:hypothetical protein|tara:strand:+ start:182 stop:412 length:231 start_codon:yes stop_codon:yes gene_type:complete